MTQIQKIYSILINECHASRKRYHEEQICVFSMGMGKKHSGKLLVVGRAPNGWGKSINKNSLEDCQGLLDSLIPSIYSTNLDWVDKCWGATKGYNTKKSAFWRVSRMLAKNFASDSKDCIDHICWSNLYKISPEEGNPSNRLMTIQFDHCVEILRSEIKHSGAENVIFLTGYGWASPFLKCLNIPNQINSNPYAFIEFASSFEGVNYVVGQHPQGKPEKPHCGEILDALKYIKSNLVKTL
jgi:hypothetical protein